MSATYQSSRFINTVHNGQYILFIADYQWYAAHAEEIEEWMDNNLPRGRSSQQGMTIQFETSQDMMMFMLRWA